MLQMGIYQLMVFPHKNLQFIRDGLMFSGSRVKRASGTDTFPRKQKASTFYHLADSVASAIEKT